MSHPWTRIAAAGIAVAGIIAAAVGSPSTMPAQPSDTIATVNGRRIPASAVQSMLLRDPSIVTPIIDQLVNDSLIDQEAERLRVTPTRDEMEGRKEQLMDLNQLTHLDGILRRHHETMADLEHDIRIWIETVKLLTPATKQPRMVQIRHILIRVTPAGGSALPSLQAHTDAEALAIVQNIQGQIKAGNKFNSLAKEYSEDLATRENGGSLGVAYEGGPFEDGPLMAALALTESGEMAAPVKTPEGYDLIQAVNTGTRHPASENALYANVAIEFRARQMTDAQTQAFVKSLRDRATTVNLYSGN